MNTLTIENPDVQIIMKAMREWGLETESAIINAGLAKALHKDGYPRYYALNRSTYWGKYRSITIKNSVVKSICLS